ncbi:MAG: OmpA family protein [Bacteroidales bacterium]|nr:OmpA family protein [Bacteroidales bacterium]
MKRNITFFLTSALLLSSCVSMKEYESLQSQYSQANKSAALAKQELQELREENAELVRQSQAMTMTLSDMTDARHECEATLTSLNRAYAALQLHYDTTVENYMQQITGKNRDLSKANKLLEQRNRELNQKEEQMRQHQKQLEERQEQMEQNQKAISQALESKQIEIETLRSSVAKALVGFSDKGLNVETKDGKVYVSLEDQLLFASGSWEVSAQGVEALKSLAKILQDNPKLTIMVEGHTDNDAFRGTTAVKDNWDLSVMRATAVVKQLLKLGPQIDPSRVVAAGHAEYAPKVRNISAANKAKNRRTEIILTPQIKDVLNLLGQ